MRVTYGINIDEDPEDYLTIAEEVMTIFSEAFAPGRYLVETFPILRFVPSWMPGAGFKRLAARAALELHELRHGTFSRAKKMIVIPFTSGYF